MTQENIELLATDISARVKYGVKVQLTENEETMEKYKLHLQGYPLKPKLVFAFITYASTIFGSKYRLNLQGDIVRLEDCQPYLRPMSSMTKEEKEELSHLLPKDWSVEIDKLNNFYFDTSPSIFMEIDVFLNIIDWLNAHHFDYRGLIEKGLALEALKGMYK